MEVRGFKPLPHQAAVINKIIKPNSNATNLGYFYMVQSHRQCGKSVMCENLLLYYACNFACSISACVSPTLNQSRKLFKDIVNAIIESGIVSKANQSLLEIELINGSTIFFKSGEQEDGLRGYTIKHGILILDECAFLSDKILSLVLPWVQVNKCPVLMVSTPRFKSGFFYDYIRLAKRDMKHNHNNPMQKYNYFNWNDYDTSMLLTDEQKAEYKQILSKAQYTSEIEGEFIDDDGCVFEGFKDCIDDNIDTNYNYLYCGIDWGTGQNQDSTVLMTIDERGYQQHIISFNNKNAVQQINSLCAFFEENKRYIKKIYAENNSIGRPFSEMLLEKCPWLPLEQFTTTNNSKADIVQGLQVGFQNKAIKLQKNKEQREQLASYAMEYNPRTKTVTYNAPCSMHDDYCIALSLAWKSYKDGQKTGTYSISFL